MYDRRPASRVALGTPTVAALTPVMRGSCQLAILSPLARAKGPIAKADISWMAEGTSSETGHGGGDRPRSCPLLSRHGAAFGQPASSGHGRDRVGKCDRRRGQLDPRGDGRARARANSGSLTHGG